jgi:hypothetical protein
MRLEMVISDFAAALANPAAPPPGVAHGRLRVSDARRFSVYRNNVAVGLIGALEARYPASRRIAGDDLFRAIARGYVHARKPRSPVMIAYGEDFPEFAAAFLASGAASELPCLADLARLENAWVEAYHAEDAAVAKVRDLGELSPDKLPQTRIEFHPAARILRFSTPAATIWASCQPGGEPLESTHNGAEDALITRRDCDVSVRVLPPLAYNFALRLREGATLMDAALAMNDPAFDFGTHLVGLVEAGAVASIIPGGPS